MLTPNDFESTDKVEERILSFQRHYEQVAKPFKWKFTRKNKWKFTRKKLKNLMARLERHESTTLRAA